MKLEAHVIPQEQLLQTDQYPMCPALCYQAEALSTSFAYVNACTKSDGEDGVQLGVILLPKVQSSNEKKSVSVSRVRLNSTPSTHAIPEQHNYQAWQEVWQKQHEEQLQQEACRDNTFQEVTLHAKCPKFSFGAMFPSIAVSQFMTKQSNIPARYGLAAQHGQSPRR